MNNIKCLDYESNWRLSMFRYYQFQDSCCWEKKKIPTNLYHCYSISICFPYSKCIRVIELEADKKHSYFWMRKALPWPWHGGDVESPAVDSDPERCSLGGWPPPTECDFEGPHSKIRAMGPEFLATWGQSWFQAHPQFITLYLPSFPYYNCQQPYHLVAQDRLPTEAKQGWACSVPG